MCLFLFAFVVVRVDVVVFARLDAYLMFVVVGVAFVFVSGVVLMVLCCYRFCFCLLFVVVFVCVG